MCGHLVGIFAMRCRRKNKFLPRRLQFFQIFNKPFFIWEKLSFNLHMLGYFLLGKGAPCHQPADQIDDLEGIAFQVAQDRFDKQIGPHQRSVQIHHHMLHILKQWTCLSFSCVPGQHDSCFHPKPQKGLGYYRKSACSGKSLILTFFFLFMVKQ